MTRLILFLIFTIELYFDRTHLPEGEITWKDRIIMMVIAVAVVCIIENYPLSDSWKLFALSCAPYPFFDPVLSVLRFGWKQWSRLGTVKYWDRFFQNVQDLIGKWVLLILRAMVCGLLIWYAL